MFQYFGENTNYRIYSAFGVLTSCVYGIQNERPKTLAIATRIPVNSSYSARITFMEYNLKGNSRFTEVGGIDIPLGKAGPYKHVINQNLLLTHSVCLEFLRKGEIIEDSRLADIVTGVDILGEPARQMIPS